MTISTQEYKNLIAGNYPLKFEEVSVSTTFKLGDVVAFDTNGVLKLAGESDSVVGIMTRAVSGTTNEPVVATMAVKGEFNENRLNFAEGSSINTHKRRMTEIGLLTRPVQ